VWKQEGTLVRRQRRSWLTLMWSLWLIVASGAVVLVCMSHPDTHEGPHPLLCLDLSTPATLNGHGPALLAEGRKLRSPHKVLTLVIHPATLGTHLAVVFSLLMQRSRWTQEDLLPSALASFPPVLRL
jgi:hypothetical protein